MQWFLISNATVQSQYCCYNINIATVTIWKCYDFLPVATIIIKLLQQIISLLQLIYLFLLYTLVQFHGYDRTIAIILYNIKIDHKNNYSLQKLKFMKIYRWLGN